MRARFALTLSAVVFATLAALPDAHAQGVVWNLPALGPTAFTFTDTTLLGFRGSDFGPNPHDWDFFFLTERLDIAVQAAPWRLYLRFDSFTPWNQDNSCSGTSASLWFVAPNYRPERATLRYQRGDVTAEIGDYYQVFGRGIALAFRKVDPLGLDTTLRGAHLDLDRGRMILRAFGGQANPQNLDPITLTVFPDPNDFLFGGSAGVRLGPDEDIEVSGHVVHTTYQALDVGTQDNLDVAGFRTELPALMDGNLSLYGEYDALRRQSTLHGVATDFPGHAFYASAQLIHGPWTVLAEWKDYTHYLLAPTENNNYSPQDIARQYSAAPTLERDDQRPYTNANARGGRVRVDYNMPSAPWILTFNSLWYGWANSYDTAGHQIDPWDPHQGYLTSHTYFSIRRRTRVTPNAPQDAHPAGAPTPGSAVYGASGVGSAGSVQRVSVGDYALYASVGYRREFHVGTDASASATEPPQWSAGDIQAESIQGEIDLGLPVGPNDSIDIRVDNWFQREYTFVPIPSSFNLGQLIAGARGGVALSWARGTRLVLSALLRWDNTNRGVGQASLDYMPFGMLTPVNVPVLYPAGEIRWNFTSGDFVRLFGGMTPGGLVCSGGVCRDVPLFQGALMELVLRI